MPYRKTAKKLEAGRKGSAFRMPRRIGNSRESERHASLPAGFSQQNLQDRTAGKTGMGYDDPLRKVPAPRLTEEQVGIQTARPEQSLSLSPESPFGGFQHPEKRLPSQKRPADETLVPVGWRRISEWTCPKQARNTQNDQASVRFECPEDA